MPPIHYYKLSEMTDEEMETALQEIFDQDIPAIEKYLRIKNLEEGFTTCDTMEEFEAELDRIIAEAEKEAHIEGTQAEAEKLFNEAIEFEETVSPEARAAKN